MHPFSTINAMTEDQFVDAFAGVYEASPWVARRAASARPFPDEEAFLAAFRGAVGQASPAEQDALIAAHPDLGGKLARSGALTADSTREQSRLGLDRLDEGEFENLDRLNRAYRERFGFPFIICAGLLGERAELAGAFQARMENTPAEERAEALRQIHLIAKLRLSGLVEGIAAP